MSATIHPTAVVSSEAELGCDVEIGPFAILEGRIQLGDRCRVEPHACLRGPLEVGPDCGIGVGVVLGHDPQIKGNDGPFGATRIGARNRFREYAQVHRSMKPEGETVIGDDGYFMTVTHVAHDCHLGDDIVMVSYSYFAGHVTVEDRVFVGGGAGIHQFCRIGTLAMIGGHASLNLDVPPYGTVVGGRPAEIEGLNVVGLRRAGITAESRRALQEAYRVLFRSNDPIPQRLEAVQPDTLEVAHLLRFLRESKRGVHGFARHA